MAYTRDSTIKGTGTTSAEAIQASLAGTPESGMAIAAVADALRRVRAIGRAAFDASVVQLSPTINASVLVASVVQPSMFGLRHDLKILRPVIASNLVAVVRDFIGCQVATKHRLSNKPVLSNEPPDVRIGVFWAVQVDVPATRVAVGSTPLAATIKAHASEVAILRPLRLMVDGLATLEARSTGRLNVHRMLLTSGANPRTVQPVAGLHRVSILPCTSQKAVL